MLQSARIVATSQQTRFHIVEHDVAADIHVPGINLSIVAEATPDPATVGSRRKLKTKTLEQEILKDANLDLKPATCYGLIGVNGSGKSTLLKALGDGMIPGMPRNVRVAVLQQKASAGSALSETESDTSFEDLSVLEYVLETDPYRQLLKHEIRVLTGDKQPDATIDSSEQVAHYRRLRFDRATKELEHARNEALLRSGSRGAKARTDLVEFEARVKQAEEHCQVDEDVESDIALAEEASAAVELLSQLQMDLSIIDTDDLRKERDHILSGLGFDQKLMETPFSKLSGGWKMRTLLTAALLQQSHLLVLDEPTNFLDLFGIMWLQHYLEEEVKGKKIVILVSHDRDFVDTLCDNVIILRDHSLTYFNGNLTEYEEDLRSKITYLTRMQETQDKEADRVKKTIAANIRLGKETGDDNKLKMAKSRQKKLEDRTGMMVGANGQRFKLNRDRVGRLETKLAAIEIPTFEQGSPMQFPVASDPKNPGPLVSLERIFQKYSQRGPTILDNVNMSIHAGDRVGVMGMNGSGKTTLIRIIAEELRPTQGLASRHPRLKLGYYSQHAVEDLERLGRENASLTALELVMKEAGDAMNEQDVRGLLGSFGLAGYKVSSPICSLSGGQLVRLALTRILWTHPNLLVLDEPSTHLDYLTVDALGEALQEYDGAILLITHDRSLMSRVIEGKQAVSADADDQRGNVQGAVEQRRVLYQLVRGELKERSMEQIRHILQRRLTKLGLS